MASLLIVRPGGEKRRQVGKVLIKAGRESVERSNMNRYR